MIITDDFVVLNYPKTGSSFVRKALKIAYWNRFSGTSLLERLFYRLKIKRRPMFREIFLPNIKVANSGRKDQHGTYEQIPPEFRDREVVTAVRNPYERLLSAYEHRHWVQFPPMKRENLLSIFPHFPDLSFEDFLKLNEVGKDHRIPHIIIKADIGIQTIQFIQMLFREPVTVLQSLDDEYLATGQYRRD
ncbi:MAG: sulfotransferase family 2 domain-containing protein, partial [Thermodesulfobacteriota bacterium]|nr:sulfotransferase family 2 domain-containing protein [Thermodesulfobacteriota bacterium]